MTSRTRRRILGWAVYVGLVVAVCEGASALFVIYVLPRFKPYYLTDFYDRMAAQTSDAEITAFARNGHDPELGWDYRPKASITVVDEFGHTTLMTTDATGARTLPATGPVLIAAYGASLTGGTGDNDDQTWEYFLSRQTGTSVANFGVGAYGPDQALLKIERNFRRGQRAPIVIFAISADLLNRVVNVYVPFFSRGDSGLMFKPMFEDRGGAMQLVNLAPRPLATRADFLQAFEQAKRVDYWYACRMRAAVTPQFPYLLTVVRALVLRPFLKRTCPAMAPAAGRILSYLLERFVDHAAANHYVPVLVIIPEEEAELAAGRSKIDPALVAALGAKFAGRLKLIDLAALRPFAPAETQGYNLGPGRGHISAGGNRLIATLLADQLRPEIEQARKDMAMARRPSWVSRAAPPSRGGTRRSSRGSCARVSPRRPRRHRRPPLR